MERFDLLVTPTVVFRPVPRAWLLTETEMKQRWVRPDTRAFKTAFEAGRMMRRGLTMAIRPEFKFCCCASWVAA